MSKTILLVNEFEYIGIQLEEVLKEQGFVVLRCDEDWTPLVCEKRNVDLIILGAVGRQFGGLELVIEIRKGKNGKNTPILMLGEKFRNNTIRQSTIKRYSLVDFLESPVNIQEIHSVVNKLFHTDRFEATDSPDEISILDSPQLLDGPVLIMNPEEELWRMDVFKSASWGGRLSKTPFPELISRLYQERASGAALLRFDRQRKLVYLKEGNPVLVQSNRIDECLGKLLVKARIITPEDCEFSLQQMRETGRKQGEILAQMGCISPYRIRQILELQHQVKLIDIFGWEDGTYKFNDNLQVPSTPIPFSKGVEDILFHGIKRKFSLQRLQLLLDDHMDQIVIPNPTEMVKVEHLVRGNKEKEIISRIKGNQTLFELSQKSPSSQLFYQVIYALKCAGILTFVRQVELEESQQETEDQIDPKVTLDAIEPLHEFHNIDRHAFEQLTTAFRKKVTRMKRLNYFEVIGVTPNTPPDRITRSFNHLIRRYHPERIKNMQSKEMRELFMDLFALICSAYSVLGNDIRRQKYIEELKANKNLNLQPQVLLL